jgi:hypothetical protein
MLQFSGPHRPANLIRRPARRAAAGMLPETLERRVFLSTTTYDISGVGNASLDQPEINTIFRTSPNGNPLGGTGPDDGLDVKAFLDTGTSASLLSQESAAALGITPDSYNGQPIVFTDVGVGGGETFDVSGQYYAAMAPSRSLFDGDLPVEDFNQTFGPTRLEINQQPADDLTGPLDIIGMPALQGKVMVMDPSPLNNPDPMLLDSMRTYVYNPGTPFNPGAADSDPGIPTTNLHVKLSYGDFSSFTETSPAGAPGPTLAGNPFIGSDPTGSGGGTAPGITITNGSFSTTGNFLFDTGAAASFISQNLAAQLHVHYQAGTYNTDNPVLVDDNNNPLPNQFVIPLGGIGGTVNAAGFHLSTLVLPTTEGTPIRFIDAPVLVADVSAQNPTTGQSVTLDGDFGMNFLVASIDVNGSDLGGGAAGAFNWVTFDQTRGILGLDLIDGPPADTTPPTVTSSRFNYDARPNSFDVTFSEPVATPSVSILTLMNNTTGLSVPASAVNVTYDSATNTAHFTFPGLPGGVLANGNYSATIAAGSVVDLSGNATKQNYNASFFALAGDINRDRHVDSADLLIMGQNFGKTAGVSFANGDLNGDGRVDSIDLLLLGQNYGISLPPT